jgi:hypothetical protein
MRGGFTPLPQMSRNLIGLISSVLGSFGRISPTNGQRISTRRLYWLLSPIPLISSQALQGQNATRSVYGLFLRLRDDGARQGIHGGGDPIDPR